MDFDFHVHGVAVHLKSDFLLHMTLPVKHLMIFIYVFALLHFTQCCVSLFLINQQPFLCTVFDTVSSKLRFF